MSLILHAHPLSSFCWKVLIPLYENGIPFHLQHLDLGDPSARTRFLAMWPFGKMPVLEDGDRVIAESSLIIEYLDLRHPGPTRFVPADREAALRVRLFDRLFDHYVMAPMQRVVADRLRPADQRDPLGVSQAKAQLETSYHWLEENLGAEFAVGEGFTLADCAAAPSLHYADRIVAIGAGSRLRAYLDRLEARPSVARVLEEARPWDHLYPRE